MFVSRQSIAVAGIGGFATQHHQALFELESEQSRRVVATCDPREASLAELKNEFQFSRRGIAIFSDFQEMLEAGNYDWVSLATPIGLHAGMHAACVNRGIPCYLEKPPTLDPLELERMIVLDSRALRTTQVGFNYVYEPERLILKERLLSGEFGALRRVGVRASWRRNRQYYGRNNWAGRLLLGDTLLLDSCMGNAMAHHVHNVLFFAGSTLDSWGECGAVEAQLLRANAIEGADTVFLRGELESSVEIRLALTHAEEANGGTEETLVCERAVIRIFPQTEILIEFTDGRQERISIPNRNNLKINLKFFGEYVAGAPHQLLSTLVHCRPFVQLNAMAYLSTGQILQVTPPLAEFNSTTDSWQIHGIEERLRDFVETGDFTTLASFGDCSPQRVKSDAVDWSAFPDKVRLLGNGSLDSRHSG